MQCMEKGLKTLQNLGRTRQKKSRIGGPGFERFEDGPTLINDPESAMELGSRPDLSAPLYSAGPYSRPTYSISSSASTFSPTTVTSPPKLPGINSKPAGLEYPTTIPGIKDILATPVTTH